MTGQEPGEVVRTQDAGRIRIVTMHRPDRLNAFNLDMIVSLCRALETAAADDGVHVVAADRCRPRFLQRRGPSWHGQERCQRRTMARPTAPQAFDRLQMVLEAFPKPLVAAVNGLGVGFGFTMLGYCDFCFVAQSARLRTPFSQLGLSPEGSSSYIFPQRMGWAAAARALMLGDWFSAQELVDAGMAQEVVPDDSADGGRHGLCRTLRRLPAAIAGGDQAADAAGASGKYPADPRAGRGEPEEPAGNPGQSMRQSRLSPSAPANPEFRRLVPQQIARARPSCRVCPPAKAEWRRQRSPAWGPAPGPFRLAPGPPVLLA